MKLAFLILLPFLAGGQFMHGGPGGGPGGGAGQRVPHREQSQGVWEGRRDGTLLPLKEIERRTVARMPGWQYLGVDFDQESGVYTLKFLRNGSVAWVEVDGRTGEVIGRAGH